MTYTFYIMQILDLSFNLLLNSENCSCLRSLLLKLQEIKNSSPNLFFDIKQLKPLRNGKMAVRNLKINHFLLLKKCPHLRYQPFSVWH